ncbi:MAG: protein TolQ [Pseudomonadota bacterium]
MSESHSILGLIMEAGLVVQAVMALLVLASILSWAFIFQRMFFFRRSYQEVRRFTRAFWSEGDLSRIYDEGVNTRSSRRGDYAGSESIFRAGYSEFVRLRKQSKTDPESIMQGTHRVMRVALAKEEEELESGLNFLATVGSTAPYVGLFGTVWGIMNSFRGIAEMKQASLAVVAPGISEALIATAIGLFAAIPAVIAYNRYSSKADNLAGRYETFADEFSSVLHRQAYHEQQSSDQAG